MTDAIIIVETEKEIWYRGRLRAAALRSLDKFEKFVYAKIKNLKSEDYKPEEAELLYNNINKTKEIIRNQEDPRTEILGLILHFNSITRDGNSYHPTTMKPFEDLTRVMEFFNLKWN